MCGSYASHNVCNYLYATVIDHIGCSPVGTHGLQRGPALGECHYARERSAAGRAEGRRQWCRGGCQRRLYIYRYYTSGDGEGFHYTRAAHKSGITHVRHTPSAHDSARSVYPQNRPYYASCDHLTRIDSAHIYYEKSISRCPCCNLIHCDSRCLRHFRFPGG